MIDPRDIMMFEEWKESDDYQIQSWFMARKREVTEWFTKEELKGFTLEDFNWSQDGGGLIYTGCAEFGEEGTDYKLDMIVEFDNVAKGQVTQFTLVLSGYDAEDPVLLGKTTDEIDSASFTIDWMLGAIAKFKEAFPPKSAEDKNKEKAANDGNADPNANLWDN